MTFGYTTDEAEGKRIVDLAFDAGVNFFDTANTYAESRSEEILGKALQGRRRDAVVATKFFNPIGPGPNDSGMSRVHIMNAMEDSLRRLQTDYVDLLYIHHVDRETPLEEMLRALDDLVHQGKARYTACTNYEAWRLLEAIWISDSRGWDHFACYQPQYSLVVRDMEEEVIPVCRLKGVGVAVWGPLAGGFLTGKYKPGQREVEGTRSAERLGLPQGLLRPQRRRNAGGAAGGFRGNRPEPGAGGDSLGAGTARDYEHHRRRSHGGPVPRQPGGRELPPGGRGAGTAERCIETAYALPESDGSGDGGTARSRGEHAVAGLIIPQRCVRPVGSNRML